MMNFKKLILLWFSFFFTVTIVFGLIAIPSYIYWFGNSKIPWLYGISSALTFGIIYSFYKIKTLNLIKIELDLSFIRELKLQKRKITKELVRIGYRAKNNEQLFIAGFRADYYLSPSIKVEYKNNKVILEGPAFYLKKIQKRINKAGKKSNKNKLR